VYEDHFGLREAPFGITPDTSFLFACRSHRQALNLLLIAAKSGEGFTKIVGEVGTGKSLLCRRFLALSSNEFRCAYIPNPYLEPRALLLVLAEELGMAVDAAADQHRVLRSLNLALLNFARAGKRVVLCLDEAQAMPIETLETLRLLSNLETEKRKLLQVILFGQPELEQKLARNSIRQLRQRITYQYRLSGLTRAELRDYLAHRMNIAGYRGGPVFDATAVATLARASRGVPRLVNILAHKSLLAAYGEGRVQVNGRDARRARADTPEAYRWWRAPALRSWRWNWSRP
jgi:MSHA biogenesis protein MshM